MANQSTGVQSSKVVHCGPTYLMTVAELEKNAIATLGSMDEGTYEEFAEKMAKIAREAGIVQPKMGIGIKFKEGAHSFLTEQAYPITKNEWEVFRQDARRMCEYIPKVFVIDGSKFTLPI